MELKNILSEKRYMHCVRTMEMAEKLADIYGVDKEKARLAGLYHDIAKELSLDQMLELVGSEYDDILAGYKTKNVLHGFAGAKYLEKIGINDKEIQDAVRYHTIGKKNMTMLEKIVYIADAIELGRNYDNVEEIRNLCYKDIDAGILMEIDYKIKNLIDRKLVIHKNTLELRNELLRIKTFTID